MDLPGIKMAKDDEMEQDEEFDVDNMDELEKSSEMNADIMIKDSEYISSKQPMDVNNEQEGMSNENEPVLENEGSADMPGVKEHDETMGEEENFIDETNEHHNGRSKTTLEEYVEGQEEEKSEEVFPVTKDIRCSGWLRKPNVRCKEYVHIQKKNEQ